MELFQKIEKGRNGREMKCAEMHNFLKHCRKTTVLFSYSIHQLAFYIQAFLHKVLPCTHFYS